MTFTQSEFRLVSCPTPCATGIVSDHGTGYDCHAVAKEAKADEYWVYKFEREDWQICGHWYRRSNGTYGEIV